MGSICENTCEGDLKFLREDALLWNKNVLEGMHAREELMRTYQLKKNIESKWVIFLIVSAVLYCVLLCCTVWCGVMIFDVYSAVETIY